MFEPYHAIMGLADCLPAFGAGVSCFMPKAGIPRLSQPREAAPKSFKNPNFFFFFKKKVIHHPCQTKAHGVVLAGVQPSRHVTQVALRGVS